MDAKLAHCGANLACLHRQNISYTPIVWSASGGLRPHTLTVFHTLSNRIEPFRNVASVAGSFSESLGHHA